MMKMDTLSTFIAMAMYGMSESPSQKEINNEFWNDGKILAEYELIKNKKSKLSRAKREIIERRAKRILASIVVVRPTSQSSEPSTEP